MRVETAPKVILTNNYDQKCDCMIFSCNYDVSNFDQSFI
jgi:hypothetical protein